jgi:hypothetical protein
LTDCAAVVIPFIWLGDASFVRFSALTGLVYRERETTPTIATVFARSALASITFTGRRRGRILEGDEANMVRLTQQLVASLPVIS